MFLREPQLPKNNRKNNRKRKKERREWKVKEKEEK